MDINEDYDWLNDASWNDLRKYLISAWEKNKKLKVVEKMLEQTKTGDAVLKLAKIQEIIDDDEYNFTGVQRLKEKILEVYNT